MGAPATAATFSYNPADIGKQGTNGGKLEQVNTTFDDVTDLFTWSSTFSRNPDNGNLAEGAWLVVNDGPNPRADKNEQAIFYLDGRANQNKVTAYNYNGAVKQQSWKNSTLLATTGLDVKDEGDNRTFSFSLDMTDINAMTDVFGSDWKGTAFGDKIGVWFHGLADFNADYGEDGGLSKFSFKPANRSVYDVTLAHTDKEEESVPEPGVVLALGMTAAAALFSKRRKLLAA
ncbi:MAG: PEP-CTERM sorting domain-containing protein [Phormidesmis sp.]